MGDIIKASDVLKKVNDYAEKKDYAKISMAELTEKVNNVIGAKNNLQNALKVIYQNPTIVLSKKVKQTTSQETTQNNTDRPVPSRGRPLTPSEINRINNQGLPIPED